MGLGMAYHGYGKVFGGHMDKFADGIGVMGFPMPELFAWAAALSEFVGGVLIVLGLFTRPAALCVLLTMSVAAFIKHGGDPLKKKELALAYWTIAGAVMFVGPGKYSLDYMLKKK